MTNLDKPTGEGEVDRLSTENRVVNEMSNIKESNFFVKRNEYMYLKKIKGYEAEIEALTCKLNEKNSNYRLSS
ncbi:hypothetical protein Hanom_Chr13g01201991 [Helianthus anomalus]